MLISFSSFSRLDDDDDDDDDGILWQCKGLGIDAEK